MVIDMNEKGEPVTAGDLKPRRYYRVTFNIVGGLVKSTIEPDLKELDNHFINGVGIKDPTGFLSYDRSIARATREIQTPGGVNEKRIKQYHDSLDDRDLSARESRYQERQRKQPETRAFPEIPDLPDNRFDPRLGGFSK